MGWSYGRSFPEWTSRLIGKATLGVFGHDNGLFVPMDSGFCRSYNFNGRVQWEFSSKAESDEKIYFEKVKNKHIKGMEDEAKAARIEGREEDREFMFRQEQAIKEVDRKKGALKYMTRGRFVISTPTVDDKSVFVGNSDFQFYSIDRYSGIPDWAYSCSGEMLRPPRCR